MPQKAYTVLTEEEYSELTLTEYEELLLEPLEEFDVRNGIFSRRNGQPIGGGLPHRLIEQIGGQETLLQSYEPDPNTAREQFYYNTRLNALFRRIDTKNSKGNPTSIWRLISEC